MWTFMAGKRVTGARVARRAAPRRVPESPRAARPRTWAVQGATTIASAQSAREMWGMEKPFSGSR